MTKRDIIDAISETTGMNKNDIHAVLQYTMCCIVDSVEQGDEVYLRGFGTFMRKKRKAKTARDLKANKAIEVPEHDIPYFRPSKKFKEVLR